MKTIVRLLAVVCILIIAVVVLTAQQQAARHAALIEETIRYEAQALAEQNVARAAQWTQFIASLYDLALVLAGCLAAMAAGAVLVVIFTLYEKARLRRYLPAANGLYPLQQIAGEIVNPNLAIYAHISDNHPGAVPAQAALAQAHSIDRVRISANMAQLHLNAAGAKLLAGRYDPPQATAWQVAPATPPAQLPASEPDRETQLLDLASAWQQSTANRWLLGQSDAGATYSLDLASSVHVGLLGATGTGKTSSTALMIALNARRHGYQVVVLDGKGGIDWRPYAAAIEVWAADYTTIGDQLATIERLHRGRMATLQSHDAANIGELTDISYPPTLVIIEEYGYISQALRSADSSAADRVAGLHSNLMRVSRATGVHFLLVDQSPQGWPGVIRANIKTWISYRLGGGQAGAVNMYATHKLPKSGAFMASDEGETIYRSWHTASHARPLLRQLPPPAQRIISAPYTVRPVVHEPVPDPFAPPFTSRSPEVAPPPPPATNEPQVDQVARWQALVDQWFSEHPEALTGPAAGISDIARCMAAADGRPEDFENYKSISHKMFHEFRRSVRVNGAPLGADKSQEI